MKRSVGPVVSARKHFVITPSDTVNLDPRPRVIKALTAGDVELVDEDDVSIIYAVEAGDELLFSAEKVGEDTTADVVGWL